MRGCIKRERLCGWRGRALNPTLVSSSSPYQTGASSLRNTNLKHPFNRLLSTSSRHLGNTASSVSPDTPPYIFPPRKPSRGTAAWRTTDKADLRPWRSPSKSWMPPSAPFTKAVVSRYGLYHDRVTSPPQLLIFNLANLAKSRPGSSKPGKCFFRRPFAISSTNHLPLTHACSSKKTPMHGLWSTTFYRRRRTRRQNVLQGPNLTISQAVRLLTNI